MMRCFFNIVRFVLLGFLYSFRNRVIDENVIKMWVGDVLKKFDIEIECRGNFSVNKAVVMANHESYFDIVALYKCFDVKLLWVAKKELFKYPVISKALKGVGAIAVNRYNDREAAVALLRIMRRFENGVVVIFPQGTRRNKDTFKKGGIFVAKRKKTPILPVKIVNSDWILPVSNLCLRSGKVVVYASDLIDVENFEEDEIERIVKEKIYN